MYVIVAGGGKIGYYLTKTLVNEGYEVLLIEKDKQKVEIYSERFGNVVVRGDACEASTLAAAGTGRADVVVAATGDDEDNLVVSLLAKQEFAVPRVVARVNHPDNAWMFNESWGVDVSVSMPHLLTSLVEEAVTVGDLIRLLSLEQGQVSLLELTLAEGSPADGKVIRDLHIPPDCSLVAIVRDRHVIPPKGETPLHAGDEVLAIARPEAEGDLKNILAGDEE